MEIAVVMIFSNLKNLIGIIVIGLTMTGCSYAIPDKPFPTTQDYNMASLGCLQVHDPSTTFYGNCVQDQIEPRIEEIKRRESLKTWATTVEVGIWLQLLTLALSQAWWDGVAAGSTYY